MHLQCYETPGAFLEDNRELLSKNEAGAQLTVGNALANRERPCGDELLFGVCRDEQGVLLLFGFVRPFNLCVNCAEGRFNPEAVSLLAAFLRKRGIAIPGINASRRICDVFRPAYGGEFHPRTMMDIMVLKELSPFTPAAGQSREATEADVPLLARWRVAFHEEAVHEEVSLAESEEVIRDLLKRGVYLFETPEGKPVSVAAKAREYPHGSCVNFVYTPPEERGRGCAQSNVANLCRRILDSGKEYCTLFVDRANPVSNRVYKKIGFRILEDNCDYRICQKGAHP